MKATSIWDNLEDYYLRTDFYRYTNILIYRYNNVLILRVLHTIVIYQKHPDDRERICQQATK